MNEHPPAVRGWIGYDAECAFCQGWVRRWEPRLGPRGFLFLPLQDSFWRGRLRSPQGEIPTEIKLLLPDGRMLGGAEALVWLARTVWWLAPLAGACWLPGLRRLTSAAYGAVARHRRRLG